MKARLKVILIFFMTINNFVFNDEINEAMINF